jgi:6-phospho-3-hexuloisomerase
MNELLPISDDVPPSHRGLPHAIELILAENKRVLDRIDVASVEQLVGAIIGANRVFVTGEGRSGLAGRMIAMRIMHLGYVVHVQGETTTPALREGDLLIALSGSGTTASVVRMAAHARALGARIVAITAEPASPLATSADLVIRIEAAGKQDHSGRRSKQFAGSLFEQAAVLLFDAMFHDLSRRLDKDAETLWRQHTNLE